MTPQEFERLAPREKNEVARMIYGLMIGHDHTKKTKCPTCGDSFPEDSFVDVNGEGFKICPRCVFVLALYKQAGVEKQVFQGRHDLNPARLNARFRKILDEDYYRNPAEAYRKYLPDMIEAEEVEMRIIHVSEEQFRKVQSGSFPFLLFSDEDVAKYRLGKNVEITLESEGNGELKRTIYAMHRMPGRFAKKYSGSALKKNVCFLPEENDLHKQTM